MAATPLLGKSDHFLNFVVSLAAIMSLLFIEIQWICILYAKEVVILDRGHNLKDIVQSDCINVVQSKHFVHEIVVQKVKMLHNALICCKQIKNVGQMIAI